MTTCPAPAGFFLARFKPVSARWPFGGSPPSGFRPDSRQAPSPPSVYFGVRPYFRFPGLRAWRPWKKTFHFAAINVFLPQRTRKNFPVGFAPMHHLFTEVRYRWLRAPATNVTCTPVPLDRGCSFARAPLSEYRDEIPHVANGHRCVLPLCLISSLLIPSCLLRVDGEVQWRRPRAD